jgi:UDP-N-acetylglucosamine 2-epimerase (hydrolysing)
MLDQVLSLFSIRPDLDLNVMTTGQTLDQLTSRVIEKMTTVLEREQPDCLLIQGDTTTVMASALAAFYLRIPVAHVEAGLRTYKRYSPFPEEINRRIVSAVADVHFAPTATAVDALREERVPDDQIVLTGNTVVDALLWTASRCASEGTMELLNRIRAGGSVDDPIVLVTGHRRENFGAPFESMCRGLRMLADRNSHVQLVYPVHLNPEVQRPVRNILQGHPRIHLVEPLSYESFVHLMKASTLVITDSGGVQEEAPALGKPVLVVRNDTERPEAVRANVARLIGTSSDRIVKEAELLLCDEHEYASMARSISPYGDGHAAQRIVDSLLARYEGTR